MFCGEVDIPMTFITRAYQNLRRDLVLGDWLQEVFAGFTIGGPR
jgi:hypothetical protein